MKKLIKYLFCLTLIQFSYCVAQIENSRGLGDRYEMYHFRDMRAGLDNYNDIISSRHADIIENVEFDRRGMIYMRNGQAAFTDSIVTTGVLQNFIDYKTSKEEGQLAAVRVSIDSTAYYLYKSGAWTKIHELSGLASFYKSSEIGKWIKQGDSYIYTQAHHPDTATVNRSAQAPIKIIYIDRTYFPGSATPVTLDTLIATKLYIEGIVDFGSTADFNFSIDSLLAKSGGSLDASKVYYYAFSGLYDYAYESVLSNSDTAETDASNKKVKMQLKFDSYKSVPRLTHFIIYRSDDNGTTFNYLDKVGVEDNGWTHSSGNIYTYTYFDSGAAELGDSYVTRSNLGRGDDYKNIAADGKIPNFGMVAYRYGAMVKGRMFVAKFLDLVDEIEYRNVIRYAHEDGFGNYVNDAFPLLNYIILKQGSGDEITGLLAFADRLVAIMNNDLFVINIPNGNQFSWYVEDSYADIGSPFPNSITQYGAAIFFVSKDNVYLTTPQASGTDLITANLTPLANSIQDTLISYIDATTDVDSIFSIYYPKRDQLMISFPMATGDPVLVWDKKLNAWHTHKYNSFPVLRLINGIDGELFALAKGDSIVKMDTTTTDINGNITVKIQSGWSDLGYYGRDKDIYNMDAFYRSDDTLDVYLYTDRNTTAVDTVDFLNQSTKDFYRSHTTNLFSIKTVDNLNELRWRITTQPASYFELNDVRFMIKPHSVRN